MCDVSSLSERRERERAADIVLSILRESGIEPFEIFLYNMC